MEGVLRVRERGARRVQRGAQIDFGFGEMSQVAAELPQRQQVALAKLEGNVGRVDRARRTPERIDQIARERFEVELIMRVELREGARGPRHGAQRLFMETVILEEEHELIVRLEVVRLPRSRRGTARSRCARRPR